MDPHAHRLTRHLVADGPDPRANAGAIAEAAALLRAGGTVAFATETVYGLGANALDPAAVARIFVAKQRPAWDPLIVHVADAAVLHTVVGAIPAAAQAWMQSFFPGPLTLLLPRGNAIGDEVTAGRPRVGVRMPRHPVAHALLRAAGVPVAAPSANLFGHVSPTSAAHVLADLDGRIDAVLDAGPTEHGLESTVVDACEDPCLVYRPGAVTLEQLAAVWPGVRMYEGSRPLPGTMPSPGLGLRHYAPRAKLLLVAQGPRQAERFLDAVAGAGEGTGVLLPRDFLSPQQARGLSPQLTTFPWGSWGEPGELAHRLFDGLRMLDKAGVERIVCALPPEEGIGAALCDRLRKAAHSA